MCVVGWVERLKALLSRILGLLPFNTPLLQVAANVEALVIP